MKYFTVVKKTATLFLLFMLVSMVAVAIRVEPVAAGVSSGSIFYAESISGYIVKWGTSYPPTSFSSYGEGYEEWVGQKKSGSFYYQYRGYLSFDTDVIPDEMEIVSANLSIAIFADYSDTDFNVTVYSGEDQWTTLDAGAGAWDLCSTLEGSFNTSGKVVAQYYNVSIAPSSINKAGTTQFRLVSSREGTEPTGDEYVYFYKWDDASFKPRLQISWTTPPPAYYVDDDATEDGTADDFTGDSTLEATTEVFSTTEGVPNRWDAGDAVEFLTGIAAGNVTTILSVTSATLASLSDDVYAAAGDTFNLVDLDDPSTLDPFRYIQSALDIANSDYDIIVNDGNYTENLQIPAKTGQTLKSISGAESTCIYGQGGVAIDAMGAHYFTLGAPGRGFNIKGALSTWLTQISSGLTGITIQHNIFNSIGGASKCIYVIDKGVTVHANTFIMDAGDVGVEFYGNVSTLTVSDNNFTGPATGNAVSVNFTAGCTFTSAVISGNTITGATSKIQLQAGLTLSGITYQGNTFAETAGAILVEEPGAGDTAVLKNLVITGNTFGASTLDSYAFNISSDVEAADINYGTVSVNYNNFLPGSGGPNNNEVVLNNVAGTTLNAEANWWGDATGPQNTTNPIVTGEKVSNNVDYCPWLDAAYPGGQNRSFNVFIDLNKDGAWDTGESTYNATQHAIDAATSGDTILVYHGTYDEGQVNITKGITLCSTSGASATIINVTGYGFCIIENNVTVDGFTFTPNDTVTVGLLRVGIRADNATYEVANVTIQNNIFKDFTSQTTKLLAYGVAVGTVGNPAYPIENVTITNNIFKYLEATGGANMSGIALFDDSPTNAYHPTNVSITRNTIYNITSTGNWANGLSIEGNNVSIHNNTIYNISGTTSNGILINATSTNIDNDCNEIYNSTDYGIQIGTSVTKIDIIGDNIHNNSIGIRLQGSGDKAYISFNSIHDNYNYGLKNDGAPTVTAEKNWWGPGGTDAGKGEPGAGGNNDVQGNVDYDPWLHAGVEGATNETVIGSGTVDARDEADTLVTFSATGNYTVLCAEYTDNPQDSFSTEIGKYYDVSINSTIGVISPLTIKFYYTDSDIAGFIESELRMYYWTGSSWVVCDLDAQTLHTDDLNSYSGYIEVTITTDSNPSLSDLEFDLPFLPAATPVTEYNLNIQALNYADDQILWDAEVHMTNSTHSVFGTVNTDGWYNFTGISDSSVTWWIEWQGSTVWYESSQNMGANRTIQQHCKVTDVTFTAKDPGGTALSSTGCQWHIIVPNSSNYIYNGNPVTLSDLVNGTYNLRVKWLGAWACDNVSWDKNVETSKDVTVPLAGFVVFTANDSAGVPLTDDPCYWYIEYPNGTTKEYHGQSLTVMLSNATYKLGVKWQGTYVVSNQTWTKTTETSYSINCSEIVDRTFTAKDDNDVQLWSDVTKFWITFPNGTLYTAPSNSSSFTLTRLANGTYTVKIAFEGSTVLDRSYTFVQTLKDISFKCNVFKYVPVLQDMKNVTYSGAEIYLSCPNGTMNSLTTDSDGKATILQIQTGSYSILNATYLGHKVNQTDPFNIGSNLLNWTVQFNGLSINETLYPYPVPLNSTFDLKVQLVYNYTGSPVPSGSFVGLLGASELNATTDASGWATFKGLSEWQPVDPYIAFGINESGYNLTYTMQNMSISVPWAGDFNIQTLDSKGYALNNASILITNGTSGYWKTVYTDTTGLAHIEDALCQDYTITVEWKGVEVGSTSINLNRAVISKNVSCTVYYWDIRVFDLDGQAIPETLITVYRPDESVYGTYETNETGYIPQIQQIPEETYKVMLNYTGAIFGATYTLNQNRETEFSIALAPCPDVPEVENISYTTTESTVLSVAYHEAFKELEIDVTGTSGTSGTLSIFIPNTLLENLGLAIENVHAFIEGEPVTYTTDAYPDGYLMTISYTHSSHVVEVVFSDITLTTTVYDSNNRAIEDANIKLYREGTLVEQGYTNDDGYAAFANLATGEYEIKTFHLNVSVKTSQVTLTGDYDYTAFCPVYDLTIQVFDIIPSLLPGASVTASLPNGTVLFSGTTNVDGNVTFYQAPASDYEIRATYFGASTSTDILLNQNLTIEIHVPMLNMMTMILILTTVGIAATVIGAYYRRRREEKPKRRRGRPRKIRRPI